MRHAQNFEISFHRYYIYCFFDVAFASAYAFAFALNVLPLIIVMSTLSALLWHWRVLPMVIKGLSYVCEKLFNLGGPISFGAAANVFVGQVEAPLFVKPYLSKMSKKELLILMTAGRATVSGSVMIALAGVLESQFTGINIVQHFLTASILSIPGAIPPCGGAP